LSVSVLIFRVDVPLIGTYTLAILALKHKQGFEPCRLYSDGCLPLFI